jgi:hypothetical protein
MPETPPFWTSVDAALDRAAVDASHAQNLISAARRLLSMMTEYLDAAESAPAPATEDLAHELRETRRGVFHANVQLGVALHQFPSSMLYRYLDTCRRQDMEKKGTRPCQPVNASAAP